MIVPLDAQFSTQFTVDTTLDGQRVYAYREYADASTRTIDPTVPSNWVSGNFTALGVNNSYIYQSPTWNNTGLVYPFEMGNQLVLTIASAPYGASDAVSRQSLAQAMSKVNAMLTRMKVTITTQVGSRPPNIYKTS